jgi:hypothetical protein
VGPRAVLDTVMKRKILSHGLKIGKKMQEETEEDEAERKEN